VNKLVFWFKNFLFVGLLVLFGSSAVFALTLEELQRNFENLADEVENMKLGEGGHGEKRVSVHGYGELHYNNPSNGPTQLDNHRFVLGIHVLLADWIHLNAEIDYEHAAQELEFEFAYLDFLIKNYLNIRAGALLIPVGFLNEFHEPPLFWSVERPELQSKVIPTTWGAGGAGIFGELSQLMEGLRYRIYIVNSLQSLKPKKSDCGDSALDLGGDCGFFRPKDGIRKGRRQLDHAQFDDFAVTARLEHVNLFEGMLQLGLSFYTGATTHDLIPEGGRTTVIEGDAKFRWEWLEANGTIVNIFIADAAAITNFNRAAGNIKATETTPDNIFGFNIQGGIHLPQLLNINTDHDFIPFVLYENFDLHNGVPGGFARDLSLDTEVVTVGFSYMPASNVAIKLDHQRFNFGNNTHKNQFNMGLAYMYP